MHLGSRVRFVVGFTLALAVAARAQGDGVRPVEGRIANGLPTQDYPSVGLLQALGTVCSATLVGCRTVLTAAHCLCSDPATGQVLNGRQCNARPDLTDPAGKRLFFQHAGFFDVAGVAVHPRFQFRVQSDLALLTLARPVTGVAPSRLDTLAEPAAGTRGTVVGFGATAGSTRTGIKRAGEVTIAPCIGVADANHVCFTFDNPLGPPGGNADTCVGDSGGPLFVDLGDGDRLAGVTSGGDGLGCHPVDHSFDADVYLDRDWLVSQGGTDLVPGSCGEVLPVSSPGAAVVAVAGTLSAAAPRQGLVFSVPPGTARLRLAVNAEIGADVLLLGRAGGRPTAAAADCRAQTAGGTAFCELLAPPPGPFRARVERLAGEGDFQLTATLLPPAAPPAGPCLPSSSALCLAGGRFRVEAAWQAPDGTIGAARAVPLTQLAGAFAFAVPDDPDAAVKVIDACALDHHFWVFVAGLTDLPALVTVADTATGTVRAYAHPRGAPFDPVVDTAGFACP